MAKRPNLTPELRAEQRVDFQRCHAVGHRWDPIPVTQPPSYGAAIDLRCENCGTVRRDIVSRITGAMLARYYDYPEEYHDYERHDKNWWRSSWLESLYVVARELINVENENARGHTGKPKKLAPTPVSAPRKAAQRGRHNPTPQPATTTRQTRRVKRNAG